MDLFSPWGVGCTRHGLEPDAVHLRLYLARTIETGTATRSVAELFGAGHRAGHARVVEDALPAHLAVKQQPFDHPLPGLDPARGSVLTP